MGCIISRNIKFDDKTRRVTVLPRLKKVENDSWFRSGAPAFVVRLSRVFGIAPLVFDEDRLRVSRALMFYGCFLTVIIDGLVILLLIMSVFDLDIGLKVEKKTTNTTQIVHKVQALLIVTMNVVPAFTASGRMEIWIEVVKRVQTVKTKLGDPHYPDEINKKELVLVVVYVVTCTVLYCINGFIYMIDTPSQGIILPVTACILKPFICIVLLLFGLQYILTCRYINSTFLSFNECLKKILHSIDDAEESGLENLDNEHSEITNTTESTQLTLRQLNTIYTEICNLVDLMNEHYTGFTMLLTIITFAILIIITPYNAFNIFLIKPISVKYLILEFIWFVHHLFFICMIVTPGHRIIYETDQTQRTVNKLTRKALYCTDQFAVDLKRLFTKLTIIKPTYSPLCMFTLSRSLLISIVGAAVSYLAIVVQFRLSEISALKNDTSFEP